MSDRIALPRNPRFIFACLALMASLVAGCSSSPSPSAADAPAASAGGAFPPAPVTVASAAEETVPDEIRAVGTVEPFATVEVKSQVAGPLLHVRFVEGSEVRQGDPLFEIDPRPFQAAVRQAEAAVGKDLAQLRQAEANLARDRAQLKNAEADSARYEELTREGIAARAQYDQFRTATEVAREAVRAGEAAIESLRAAAESDRAALERARLDLSYCQIRAPISGRTGNLLVHPGNLVKADGDTPLVVINRIAPVFVTFGVPERQLGAILQISKTRKLSVDIFFETTHVQTGRGTLSVIDNTVDPNTGTIRLKATVDNKERLLWPGQFVNVTLTLDRRKATVVPSEAVQAGQQGEFVFVVKPDQTVEPRSVVVGPSLGNKIVIEKGVAPGETVVLDGQLRLFPGAPVQVVPAGKTESRAH